jgi:SynChlorMet cassette radical SAM/SPASM protein ScmE
VSEPTAAGVTPAAGDRREPWLMDPTVPPPGLARAPQGVDVALTGRCNLSCRYCFYADEMTGLSDLPTERWLALFGELGGLAVQRVTLSGGEVFVRPDLWELVDGLIASRLRYSMLTNGTLITEQTIAAFDEGKRRSRLDSIQVSIDGSRAEIHDRSRPPRSFDAALRGLRLLKEAGLPVTVRCTLNAHNVEDLPAIAELLLEDVGLLGFSTNEAEQMGTARCHGESIVLSPEQRARAMDVLTEMNERYGGRIAASAGPLAVARQYAEIDEAVARGETGFPGRGALCSCGGAFSKMAVLHDGTMAPCNMLPQLTMGTVGTHSLQEAWLHHPSINVLRQRRTIPLDTLPECDGCQYTGFCAGGCPAAVMARTGRLNAADTELCYRSHMMTPDGGHRRDARRTRHGQ